MNSRSSGFTLVEMLIVTVLATIIMGAVYRTLMVQQRSARQIGAVTATQQTIRTSAQFLRSELREVGPRWGDVIDAASDHLTFRAMRKIGFVCAVTGASSADLIVMGDTTLAQNDTIYISADRGSTSALDDTVVTAVVLNKGTPVHATCGAGMFDTPPWNEMNVQPYGTNLGIISSNGLSIVSVGAPIRSFSTVTYGIYAKGSSYVLGRKDATSGDTAVTLIGPLAPPSSNGLVLQYWDTTNQAIPTASLSGYLANIGRVRVGVTALTRGAADPSGTYSDSITTDIALRGN